MAKLTKKESWVGQPTCKPTGFSRGYLTYLIPLATLVLAGCNQTTRVFDSEISAINRQTEVLKEQNRILERIATSLEKTENKKGDAK